MSDAILKAIDIEHADLCRAANAIYTERLKAPRRSLEAARAALTKAQQQFAAAEVEAAEELKDNLGEAQRRRTDQRAAITGVRPARLSESPNARFSRARRLPR